MADWPVRGFATRPILVILTPAIERGTRVIEILDKIGLSEVPLQPDPEAIKDEE